MSENVAATNDTDSYFRNVLQVFYSFSMLLVLMLFAATPIASGINVALVLMFLLCCLFAKGNNLCVSSSLLVSVCFGPFFPLSFSLPLYLH